MIVRYVMHARYCLIVALQLLIFHARCSKQSCGSSPFLARLFRSKSRAIEIARSSSYKNFNVAHYPKSIKGINTEHWTLDHRDKMQLEDKGHNSENYSFGVMLRFNLNFSVQWWPLTDERWYTAACGALVLSDIIIGNIWNHDAN